MDGACFSISWHHEYRTDRGQMTREGPVVVRFACLRCAMSEMVWSVFPSPISSPRMKGIPFVCILTIQSSPIN